MPTAEAEQAQDHSPSPTARISTARVTEVLQRVAEIALELTGATGAYVEQVAEDEQVEVVAVVGEGTPSLGTRIPFPGSVTEEVIRGGEPVDLPTLEGVGPGIARSLEERCPGCAALLSPLLAGDELLGALILLRAGNRPFGGDDLVTLRSLGDLAAVSLRFVAEITHEREERTALLDSTGEGIYGIDPAGRCTFLNRSGADLLGYEPSEVLGEYMHALIHHTRADGSEYPEGTCPVHHAARTGEGIRISDEVLWRKDGSSFPAEYGSYPIRIADRVVGAVVTFLDISDRKRDEVRESRRREREGFLAEASVALGSSLDYEGTLDRVARLAVPRIADYCVIDVLEDGERLRRVAVAHIDPAGHELLATVSPHAPTRESDSPALAVLETGEPVYVPEVTEPWLDRVAQSQPHREIMRQLGPRSAIIVPLVARGRPVGLLWLARTSPDRPYDSQDVSLAAELGRRAGVAVDNAALYSATEEARGEAERRAREESALRQAIAAVSASRRRR